MVTARLFGLLALCAVAACAASRSPAATARAQRSATATAVSSSDAGRDAAAASADERAPRVMVPVASADRAAVIQALAPDGPCSTDADCVFAIPPHACGPCGACAQPVTRATAARGAAVRCPPYTGPPAECERCQDTPSRVVCRANLCVGILDPPGPELTGCNHDADCAPVAFDGCCACPQTWLAAPRAWVDRAVTWCASQPCLAAPTCAAAPSAPSGGAVCRAGACQLAAATSAPRAQRAGGSEPRAP